MAQCPFLSTALERIDCYRECALYECKENGGVCPFKSMKEYKIKISGDILKNGYFSNSEEYEHEISFLEKYYEKTAQNE